MLEVKKKDRFRISHLFQSMHDTVILSCLQGHMGRAWTDDLYHPALAIIQGGDFCFLAGSDQSPFAYEMIEKLLTITGLKLAFIITDNNKFGDMAELAYSENCRKIQRYRIKKKENEFDLDYLRSIVKQLPNEYNLSPIDEKWYEEALRESWSEDFVSNFLSKDDYIQRGIGRVITYKNRIISGASSYSIYDSGIEIEIATRTEFRKQGLALITGAALILACRDKGLYPSWDAANMMSVRIAEKLGYEYDKPYDTYVIRRGDQDN